MIALTFPEASHRQRAPKLRAGDVILTVMFSAKARVICCETAMRLEFRAKRKWLAHALNVADDPLQTSAFETCCAARSWLKALRRKQPGNFNLIAR